MRLWSIHPKYLDVKGLLAVWREGLLAKKVLEGKTAGYKNHPQLDRFKKSDDSVFYINAFLYQVYLEAVRRGYSFDKSKVIPVITNDKLLVTRGQVVYEFNHLLRKLELRDKLLFDKFRFVKSPEVNPLFRVVPGPVESWEKI